MKRTTTTTTFCRSAIAIAVGMCLAGAVQAQAVHGTINGTAKPGEIVTLSGPSGASAQTTVRPDGTFSFTTVAPGTYKLVSGGVTREVLVAAGVDSSVALNSVALEKVMVTGSRIQRDAFTSTSPVLVITRDEALMSGFDSTAAALQSTGVTAGAGQINNAFGGFVTDGGPGANTIGLRGLGATRTLVLLNGRRLSPAGTRGSVGSADLNVLPQMIVDRIEVLKDGASSIYGSDAIAGVVNIITKKNIDGIQLEAQYNKPEDGGGETARVSAIYGFVGDRSYFTGSVDVIDRKEIKLGDRDWTTCQTDYFRTVSSSGVGPWGSGDFIDPRTGRPKCYTITGTGANGVTINTLGTATLAGVGAPGSVGSAFNRWRPNSSIATGLAGYEGVGGGLNNLNVRDTFEPRMLNASLLSPARAVTGYLQGGFDIGTLGNGEVYYEALYSRRESSQNGFRQLTLDYSRGSPLIPSNLASVAGNFQAGPTQIAPGPIQYRAFIGAGIVESEQTVDAYRLVAGLRGDLPFADWKYDGYAMFSTAKGKYTFGTWLTDRVRNSLDVVTNNGTISCRNAANGCVPAPALSPALLGGSISQDWTNYAFTNTEGRNSFDENTFSLNTTGSLFNLPYGSVSGALGVEFRRSEIDDTPSIDSQTSNLYNLTSSAVTQGSDRVWELYGELEFPLLRGVPAAEELKLNVSGRYTDYQSYGSDTTYKVGMLWTPISAVSFRGAVGTSYRAPGLFEQFVGATTGFLSSQGDPCNNHGALNPATNRAINCASLGLPGNFTATNSIESITLGGRKSGLEAETSKNKVFGVVLQPQLPAGFGDFSLAVDYFDIRVDNGVDRIGTSNILSLCYDSASFSSQYCRLVNRAGPGTNRALSVNNSYVNVSSDVVKGYDFTFRYVRDIGPGTFRVNGLLTIYDEQANKLFPTDPLQSYNGVVGAPEKTAVVDFSYLWKAWRFRYGFEWIDNMSSYAFFGVNEATSTQKLNTPDYYLHSLSAEYKRDKWSVIFGVRNLADKEPPQVSTGFTNRVGNAPLYSGYDYVGRTWFLTGSLAF